MNGPARPDRRAVLAGLAGAALAAAAQAAPDDDKAAPDDDKAAPDVSKAAPGATDAAGLPEEPLVVDPAARGRRLGRAGGDLVTLVAKPRDIRYISAYSYTRLVGYDDALALRPDLLARFDNDGDRVYTLVLRRGHRWSDGAPFTAEDFRYWWEDVANNRDLSPSGPPEFMMVDGQSPRFEVVDPLTVRFAWDKPNPRFLPELASPRDRSSTARRTT